MRISWVFNYDPHTYVSGSLTVKIVRVYGGCLGTKSRRRTWTAAISRGEALNSHRPADLRMGKPGAGNAASSGGEYIAVGG
jgi:hypothetical protein